MNRVQESLVAVWPVIELSVADDEVVADAAGVGDPVRVAAYPDVASASRDAALLAAERLDVARCRVRGTDGDGGVWWLVVDVPAGTLEPLGGGSSSAHGKAGGWRARRSTWALGGAVGTVAVLLAVLLVVRGMLTAQVPMETAAETVAATTPPAGQLPVAAPAGWDTYATWQIEASESIAAVSARGGLVVLAADRAVWAVESATGVEVWRADTSARVTALYSSDAGQILAAHGDAGVSVLDATNGGVLHEATVEATALVLGEVVWADLAGQAGAVLVNGSWERRIVPATAAPVGAIGSSLVSVSESQASVWVTSSESPVLPPAVALVPPSEGMQFGGVLAFTRGHLVTSWTSPDGSSVLRSDRVGDDGTLTPAGEPVPVPGSARVSVDGAHGLVGVGPVLLEVSTGRAVTVPAGSVEARAGFGWVTGGDGASRIALDGSVLPMVDGAAVPDAVTSDGHAVVRAAVGATGRGWYALEAVPPNTDNEEK